MCLLHVLLHVIYILLSRYWCIIQLKKCELIEPLEKMGSGVQLERLPGHDSQLHTATALQPMLRLLRCWDGENCVVCLISVVILGYFNRLPAQYSGCGESQILDSPCDIHGMGISYCTSQYEFSSGSLQTMCCETQCCHVCGCNARCLGVKHTCTSV